VLFNFAFKYAIRRVKDKLEGLGLNGTHQLLTYVDDVNIVGENIENIKKNTEALLDASEEVGLEVNPEKTKYLLMSRSQKVGQKHSVKIANRSFEGVAKYKYLGTTLSRRRWEDGIKMDLTEIGWGGVEWIHLVQDRDRWRAVVNAVMNLRVLAPRSYLAQSVVLSMVEGSTNFYLT
jgi:hypothetical protein